MGYQKINYPVTKPSSVQVDKATNSIALGSKATIIATVLPEGVNQEVTFVSANTSKVTVKATGEYTAIAEGSSVITVATKEDPTIKTTVTVTVTAEA